MNPPLENTDAARALATEGLAFIVRDRDCLERFLTSAGLDPTAIRAAAAEPGFLAGVLDFLMHNESLLVSFAADADVSPEQVAAAHRALSGPPVWD